MDFPFWHDVLEVRGECSIKIMFIHLLINRIADKVHVQMDFVGFLS